MNNWYVDPSLMFANDSMYFHSPDNNGSFLLGTMDPATAEYFSPLVKIAEGLGGSSPEGPHMYKRNDYYYLLTAEGGTSYEHRAVVQRSDNPRGSFQPSPYNPLVSNMNAPEHPFQAIGHADMVETPDGWWLVCLGIRPRGGKYHHLGRETFLAPVTWTDDGWPVAGTNGIVDEQYQAPDLPQHVWQPGPVRDEFDSDSLNLVWNFLRNPHTEDWSLSERPGYLRLKGSGFSFVEKDSPAFICRRQTAFNVTASAKIDFTPTAPNEQAGLVVRGNDTNHYDLLITQKDGKRVVMFQSFLQDKVTESNIVDIADGGIILKISSTDLQYQFWIRQEGMEPQLLGEALTKDLSTEVIGGFTGVFIGLYASGNGKANVNPADFAWFDYEVGE